MSIKTERLLNRAKKLIKKGNLNEASEIYSNILKSSPNNAEAKSGLSSLDKKNIISPPQKLIDEVMHLYSSGNIDQAQTDVQDLIKDFPNDPLLHNISGACYSVTGPIELSIQSFNKALNLKPDYDEVIYNLGVAYQRTNQLDQALKYYEQAISLKHAYPTAHNNVGVIFLNKGMINDAIKSFEWAIAYNQNYAEAHNNLGTALQDQKKFEDAKKQYEKAVLLNPEYAQAFHNLGIICEITNLPKEALENYEKTIALNPEFAEAHRNLSKIKTFKAKEKHISQLHSMYSNKDLNISDKARVGFALAKVHEDLNNPEEQFNYLNEANGLRKKELNYSFDESKKFHSIVTNFFKPQKPIKTKLHKKTSEIKPIFIVGMPRSGTSLVEQIISSHNAVHGAGELLNFRNILTPILDNHINNKSKSFSKDDFLLINQQYLDSLSKLNTKEKFITDKMPMNFRLIGFILSSIPDAKIIHVKRNPIATCWSNYNHYFTDGNGFSYNQEDLVNFYNLYSEIMIFWHRLFPDKIYDLNYEKLTKNQKLETKKILEYCGLDWDESCLNFHKNERAVLTASSFQVRQKMYQGSSEAWKKYKSYLKPLINGLKDY